MKQFIDDFGFINYVYSKEELENFSTEKLVNFIHHNQKYRHDSYGQSPLSLIGWGEDKYIEVHQDWVGDNTLNGYYWANEDELRTILKTRPNIPNKQQRKQMLKDKISENKKNVKKNLIYKK